MKYSQIWSKTAEGVTSFVNKTSFAILAALVKRAIDGKLTTKPKKRFSKKQLDCTNTKGRTIARFLANQNYYFPAQNYEEQLRRIRFILSTLELNGVDLDVEIEDIRKNLPIEFPKANELEFIEINIPPQDTIKDAITQKIHLQSLQEQNAILKKRNQTLEKLVVLYEEQLRRYKEKLNS